MQKKIAQCALASVLLLAALACLIVTGCSSHAMKSTPLWNTRAKTVASLTDMEHDKVEGPVEDRVNVWPLFYYRKPAVSALWPLFAATEQGNAFIPAYEYTKKERELRIGTIHQALPALSYINSEKKEVRILNFYSDPEDKLFFPLFGWNTRDKTYFILPFVKDTDWAGVLPLVFWWNDSESKGYTFFPAVFHETGADGSVWNVGGFLFYREKDETHSLYFCLAGLAGGSWDRKERSRLNYVFPLFMQSSNPKTQKFLSLPYSNYQSRDKKVINAFFNAYLKVEDKGGSYESYAMPFFHRFSGDGGHGHALAPFYYFKEDKNGRSKLLTPLFGFSSNGDFMYAGGPVYVASNDHGRKTRSVLWPLSRWRSGPASGAAESYILPAYYYCAANDSTRMLVTPLGGYSQSPSSAVYDILGPLYYSSRDAASSYKTAMFPFYQEWRRGEETRRLLIPVGAHYSGPQSSQWITPLYIGWEKPEGHGFYVPPMTYYSESTASGRRHLITPLGGYARGAGDDFTYDILGPVYYSSQDGRGAYRTALFPFWHDWRSGEERWRSLLPLGAYYSSPDSSKWISPLVSRWRGKDGEGFLAPPIAYYDRSADGRDRLLITPLGGFSDDGKTYTGDLLGPLYYSRQTADRGYRSVMFPLWHDWRSGDAYCRTLLPLGFHRGDKDSSEFISPLFSRWQRDGGHGFLAPPLAYYDESGDGSKRTLVTPLGAYSDNGKTSRRDILGPLYYSRQSENGSYRTAMFPLWHDWRSGDKHWQILLPFGGHYTAPDSSKWVSPLLSYGRHGDAWDSSALAWMIGADRKSDTDQGYYVTPLASKWVRGKSEGSMALPLYYYESYDGRLSHINLMGLFDLRKYDDSNRWFYPFPFASSWQDRDTRGSWAIPLYYYEKTKEGPYLRIAPVLPASDPEGLALSLLLYKKTDSVTLYNGMPLYRIKTQKNGFYDYSLMLMFAASKTARATDAGFPYPLLWYSKVDLSVPREYYRPTHGEIGVEKRLGSLFLDLSYSFAASRADVLDSLTSAVIERVRQQRNGDARTQDGAVCQQRERARHALLGLAGWETGCKAVATEIPTTASDQQNVRRLEIAVEHKSPSQFPRDRSAWAREETQVTSAAAVSSVSVGIAFRDYSESYFFPFYMAGQTEGEGSYRCILGRLFDTKTVIHKNGEPDYERQRVLWRVLHREKEGSRVSVDMFPFMQYDRDENLKKFAFAGGLFGYGYKGDKRHVKVCWIPIHY